jgi:HEAT repeat protein
MLWEYLPIITGAALALAVGLAGAALRAANSRARMAQWRSAAQEAGLADVVGWGDGVLTGASGPLRVRISRYEEDKASGTRVEITAPRLPPNLTLRPEGLRTYLGFRDRKEIEVGDAVFDDHVSVQGPPAVALALLDPDLRRTVDGMVSGRLEVRGHKPLWATGRLVGGVLCTEERSPAARVNVMREGEEPAPAGLYYLEGVYKLPELLRASVALATRLLVPEDLAQRIASNLAAEPEAGVRRKALLTLLQEFPEHAATREALVAALSDPDAELRVRAGTALSAEGREVLLGVAGGEGADDQTSARAVAALGDSLTLAQTADLLKSALRTRRVETAKRCLRVLGTHGPEATRVLAQVLLVETGELGVAAAQALAATGDAAAEAPLVRALAKGMPWLRRAAAAALGRVGTREAVAPLRDLEARDTAARGSARQAIAEIHSRLAGAAQGQLSLAEGEAGRLSLAEGEAGRLSLSDEEPGAGEA